MSYFPLDRDLLTSSLWALGSPQAVKVWIYLLLNANPRTGVVDDAAPAIALRCGLGLEETVAALGWLSSPDPHSRTKDHEGRRIEERPEGGYLLLNYRRRQDQDHSTQRVKRFRERVQRHETVKRSETVCNGVPALAGTTNKNKNTETEERKGAPSAPLPANPLLSGRRPELEREGYRLIREINAFEPEREAWDILLEASGWEARDGRVRSKLRLETMSDDHLIRTVKDLRSILADLGVKHGQKARTV